MEAVDFRRFFYLKVYWFPENLYNKMANVKIVFVNPETKDELRTFVNTSNRVYIGVNSDIHQGEFNSGYIELDVETAVRFSRELRRQIALLKEYLKNDDYAK